MFSRPIPRQYSLVGCALLAVSAMMSTTTAQMVNLGQSDVFRGSGAYAPADRFVQPVGYLQPAGYVQPAGYGPVMQVSGTGDPYALGGTSSGPLGIQPFGGFFSQAYQSAWSPGVWGGQIFPGMMPSANDSLGRLWFRAEYLQWWTEGMDTPPLATTSSAGTAQNVAAILGEANTSTTFGGHQINDDSVPGLRLKGGFWLNQSHAVGIETEFFALRNQDDRYYAQSDGTTIIGRPFFDITNGRETAQLISFPNVASGALSIESDTDLKSFMLAGRAALNPPRGAPGCVYHANDDRIDWLVGYRYIDLDEQLRFNESIDSLLPAAPGSIRIGEYFRTQNEFNGIQLGMSYNANFNRMWLESDLRVAVGYNTQTVTIAGQTAITEAGVTDTFNGGLLAQRTNIGVHERDQFSMVPELGMKLGYRFRPWLHATVGYTVMYYPNVVRPGDQIDRDVNPNLLAPEANPFTGALRPRFRWIESDYIAHGLSLGAEVRF